MLQATRVARACCAWLDDPAIVEVMRDPDGRLWRDRLGEGPGATADGLVHGGAQA